MPTLNWIGKEAVLNHHREVPYRLLKCEGDLSHGDPGSGNLLVEGDNLEALKALLPYYKERVKCIYIDPPYNTGNEGWVYNDNVNSPQMRKWLGKLVNGETLDRHDRWLCMMWPRIALLKEFLREDGAIFISLDDNEIHALRYLAEELGLRFVTTIIWQKVYSPKNSARHFSESHDYVAVFAKRLDDWVINLLARTEEQNARYENPDNDQRGLWKPGDLSARNYYSEGRYPLTTPSGRIIDGPPNGRYWTVSRETFDRLDSEGRIWWGKDGNNQPALKRFLSEVKQGVTPQTIWSYQEAGHTQEAKKELVNLFPERQDLFSTPKPTRLIKRVLELASDETSLVLDSFSGSGTTGHAVKLLNDADGGQRKFVMVEIDPEIARQTTAERLRRAGVEFRYCTLGEPLFTADGMISGEVTRARLAHHLWFTETGEPLPHAIGEEPLIGIHNGTAILYLESALTVRTIRELPAHDGPRVVYADACRVSSERLAEGNIVFKAVPYDVRDA